MAQYQRLKCHLKRIARQMKERKCLQTFIPHLWVCSPIYTYLCTMHVSLGKTESISCHFDVSLKSWYIMNLFPLVSSWSRSMVPYSIFHNTIAWPVINFIWQGGLIQNKNLSCPFEMSKAVLLDKVHITWEIKVARYLLSVILNSAWIFLLYTAASK